MESPWEMETNVCVLLDFKQSIKSSHVQLSSIRKYWLTTKTTSEA